MTLPTPTDAFTVAGDPPPSVVYAELRSSFSRLVGGLSDEETRVVVPQCPDWTIADVLAHVVGINADFLAGRLDGVGSDAWTAVQVDERRALSVGAVSEAWFEMAEAIDRRFTDDPFLAVRLTADLVTHYHDVLGALGRREGRDAPAVRTGLLRYGPFFCDRVAAAGLPIVRVEAGVQAWQSGDGPVVASLSGSAFELLRAFSGRRSVAQVSTMAWTGDPTPYLAVVSPYGLPEYDVTE